MDLATARAEIREISRNQQMLVKSRKMRKLEKLTKSANLTNLTKLEKWLQPGVKYSWGPAQILQILEVLGVPSGPLNPQNLEYIGGPRSLVCTRMHAALSEPTCMRARTYYYI